ncbi:hypothetical protein BBF96_10285 [Anoxybacter fermentans]|uniref:ABC transporter domain-containing protein n=1 Tax=Anoxybacter fermentans TaxID=1323375 RepID=A0A3Q9HR46_9FIRM|nr:ABC transporter ATP-binding protein [Anoxybacter fermentans]AZR73738.1 hypothetical protein BBF96_10285 [Anoxybacter fermentans]
MIEIRAVSKSFETGKNVTQALSGVDLMIEKGSFHGLLGVNGAGKTTLIKIICGLLSLDSGQVRINGIDITKNPKAVRRILGFCNPDNMGLYLRLNAEENLKFFSSLYGVSPRVAYRRINALLGFFGLEKSRKKLVKDFSTGMKAKLRLAKALIHNPDVLLLDEPTSGIDYFSAQDIYILLKGINEELGTTILYTSHHLKEIEELCQKVSIIHKGKILLEGSISELNRQIRKTEVVKIKLKGDSVHFKKQIRPLPYILDIQEEITNSDNSDDIVSFKLLVPDASSAISQIIEKFGKEELVGIWPEECGLEDVLKITMGWGDLCAS